MRIDWTDGFDRYLTRLEDEAATGDQVAVTSLEHAVVVVFGFDKVRGGDIWSGRAAAEGQANVDEWMRQHAIEGGAP